MASYSSEALEKAKDYHVGEKPNEVYLYDGKLVVIYSLGGEYTYSDNMIALDAMSGDLVDFSIFDHYDFWDTAEKLS